MNRTTCQYIHAFIKSGLSIPITTSLFAMIIKSSKTSTRTSEKFSRSANMNSYHPADINATSQPIDNTSRQWNFIIPFWVNKNHLRCFFLQKHNTSESAITVHQVVTLRCQIFRFKTSSSKSLSKARETSRRQEDRPTFFGFTFSATVRNCWNAFNMGFWSSGECMIFSVLFIPKWWRLQSCKRESRFLIKICIA